MAFRRTLRMKLVFVTAMFFLVFITMSRRLLRTCGKDNTDCRAEIVPSHLEIPIYVLVLSSNPRSGSTFLAEMLSRIEQSVLFFEPLWTQESKPCIQDSACVERFLLDTFSCNFTGQFEAWLKSKPIFLRYFSPEAYECSTNLEDETIQKCIGNLTLRQICMDSKIRIVKSVRARMHSFARVMLDRKVNFKLIHLTKDPRGVMESIRHFPKWNQDPTKRCKGLEQDLDTYEVFSDRYPSKVLRVSYEMLCLQPSKEISKILGFIFETPPFVPASVEEYINSHTNMMWGKDSLSTHKVSEREYFAWRWRISKKLLASVEHEPSCLRSIQRLNHTVFDSIRRVRNVSISLFAT
ncbi:carbohydrate sulfotransferase 3-like [Palaemon carinicauda]|uniref:carbohydrate sulfotransferase 3-like n=1 Tax=Palaemon carinicauda TaxID=392227 RepID=UPI0035B5F6CD